MVTEAVVGLLERRQSVIFRESARHHGLIRLPDVPAERRILLVERLIVDHARELSEDAVATIRGGRIRISRSMP